MSLEIQQREVDGVSILDLNGSLILGDEDRVLRQRVLSLFDAGNRKLILNLKDLSTLDTTGIGTLVFFVEKFREAGGRCALMHLSENHARLSDVFKLNVNLQIYADEHEAVNSFFPEREMPHFDILEFVESREQQARPDVEDVKST